MLPEDQRSRHPFLDPTDAIIARHREYVDGLRDLDPMIAGSALETAGERVETALAMMKRYAEYWKGFDAWEVLYVEEKFQIPLKTERGGRARWAFAGKLDVVVRDREDGRVKVVDHKSTSLENRERYASELSMDPQSRSYLLLLNEAGDRRVIGEGMVLDFIFDVERSKQPATPQTLVCRSCNTKMKKDPTFINSDCPTCRGTNVSGLSQAQNVDTTPAKFEEALAKYPHLNPAEYEETLRRLKARSDSWLYRIELNFEPGEIEDFQSETYEVTREIATAKYWTRNLAACFAPGRTCVYRHLCLSEGNQAKSSEARMAFRQKDVGGAPELEEKEPETDGTMIPF